MAYTALLAFGRGVRTRGAQVLDLLMLGMTAIFFVLAFALIRWLESV
jgi:hypothetical protein